MLLEVFSKRRHKNKELFINVKRKALTSEKLKCSIPGPSFSIRSQSFSFVVLGDKHGWYSVGFHS